MQTREAMQQIADALTAGGVPTAIDPRDVNLPGGWLKRVSRLPDLLCGGETLQVQLWLIAPDIGTWDALGYLDDMYALAVDVLPPNSGNPSVDTTALLPDSATPYPATHYDALFQLTPDTPPTTPLQGELTYADQ